MSRFIWTEKNVAHIAEHGITRDEAEYVVERARPPYPQQWGDDKLIVKGQTAAGSFIQVIYVLETDAAELDYSEVDLVAMDESADSIVVLHARPLTGAEKSKLKRKQRKKHR